MNPPPIELARLGLDRDSFVRADSKSYRGPCPRCGGARRFLVFTDHPFPKWNCQCDACGLKAWADQLEPALKAVVDPAERASWAIRAQLERQAHDKLRREKLAEFSHNDLLAELSERMTAEQRAWWRSQGIPDDWQRALRIGYLPEKRYMGRNGEHHASPAYTLPYFHTGYEFVTLQYRLNDCENPAARYRFEKGLGTSYYQTEPSKPIGEQVIICEGAKKAIVTAVNTPEEYTVLGIPSKADFGGVAAAVKDAARVYVLLDPDADYRAEKLAKEIGPAARVASLPAKVDDSFTQHGLTQALFLDCLRWARPTNAQ